MFLVFITVNLKNKQENNIATILILIVKLMRFCTSVNFLSGCCDRYPDKSQHQEEQACQLTVPSLIVRGSPRSRVVKQLVIVRPQSRAENKLLYFLPCHPGQDLHLGNVPLTLRLSLPLLIISQGSPPQTCPQTNLI